MLQVSLQYLICGTKVLHIVYMSRMLVCQVFAAVSGQQLQYLRQCKIWSDGQAIHCHLKKSDSVAVVSWPFANAPHQLQHLAILCLPLQGTMSSSHTNYYCPCIVSTACIPQWGDSNRTAIFIRPKSSLHCYTLKVSLHRLVWGLIHSKKKADVNNGLRLASVLIQSDDMDPNAKKDLVYFQCVGLYKLGKYVDAKRQLDEFLEVFLGSSLHERPASQQ